MLVQLVSFALIVNVVYSHESGSAEANKIEISPLYDTIIFSDVADIINDFENNLNPLENVLTSASTESEENIENLLSEYQHYLEKAHKQRINYLEKSKQKNKVPMVRHDRYAKTKPAGGMRYYEDFYPNSYSVGYMNNKIIQPPYNPPIDILIPLNPKIRYPNKLELTTAQPRDNRDNYPVYDQRLIELPPVLPKRFDSFRPACICKSNEPCECKCKQCLVPINPKAQINYQFSKIPTDDFTNRGVYQNSEYATEDRLREGNDNNLNIRIKVDIQLPKTQDIFGRLLKNHTRDEISSKENTVTLPFPYFNFPIPMDLFGYKKSMKSNSHEASHKITIHKKKKSRLTNNGNKKHRKKVITFHNLNIQPQQQLLQLSPYLEDSLNNTDFSEKISENFTETLVQNVTRTTEPPSTLTVIALNNNNTTNTTLKNNETKTEESIYVTVNISNTNENVTEDFHKIENSVETEYTKYDINTPTEKIDGNLMLRKKRETSTQIPLNNTVIPKHSQKEVTVSLVNATEKLLPISTKNDETKKYEKQLLSDTALYYWPNNTRNETIASKNITTIILELENKREKLNMTKETIKNNRTSTLEKAIFGDVNWEDVDTVAPVFLSFVGKYLKGVLTFCSQMVCHSMKCDDKTCIHRICNPSDRWNQRGHCSGSNNTDSVASLDSIMDLPSNVVFEIVDILQDKMLGKLFGKGTLCINAKCISFIAMKKMFLKAKCSFKDLKMGYCPNIKISKTK